MWPGGGRGYRRLVIQLNPLLGWGPTIRGGPDIGRGCGPIVVRQADGGTVGRGRREVAFGQQAPLLIGMGESDKGQASIGEGP